MMTANGFFRDFKQKNDDKGEVGGQNERKVDYVILEWALFASAEVK